MRIPQQVWDLAADQDGLITRRDALARGVTPAALRHALTRGGRWQRIIPGVYATFTGPLTERHRVRAALLYAGGEAMVTGVLACRAYGLAYAPTSSDIELIVPPHVRRAPVPLVRIRRVRTMPTPRLLRGIPCAPPERAVIDSVRGDLPLRDTRAALCEVVQRGFCTADMLCAESDGVDRRGLGAVRAAIDDLRAGCRSAPECELRDVIRAHSSLPEPLWNTPVAEAPDLIPDGQYREERLALEVDSVQWHRIGDGPERTERIRARYASIGWRALPLSPRRIRDEPRLGVAEIEAARRTH